MREACEEEVPRKGLNSVQSTMKIMPVTDLRSSRYQSWWCEMTSRRRRKRVS
jgi:hypothetical protein